LVTSNANVSRIAIIAGASGLVGGHCLSILLNSPDYSQVIAFVRRPLETAHAKLRKIIVDFSHLPELPEFAGAEVFSTLGTTMKQAGSREAFRRVDFDMALAFASVAAQSGARQFAVVSSIGANANSQSFYLRVKGELEEALQPLPFSSLHIFRPCFLAGDRPDTGPAERVGITVAKTTDFTFVGKLEKYSALDASELATAMVNAAHRAQPGTHIYEYDQIIALAKS
jgi:uncharacterized protein YbjT (DUF2867 family)